MTDKTVPDPQSADDETDYSEYPVEQTDNSVKPEDGDQGGFLTADDFPGGDDDAAE